MKDSQNSGITFLFMRTKYVININDFVFRIWFYLTVVPFNNVHVNYLEIKINLNNLKSLTFLRPRVAHQKYKLYRSCWLKDGL